MSTQLLTSAKFLCRDSPIGMKICYKYERPLVYLIEKIESGEWTHTILESSEFRYNVSPGAFEMSKLMEKESLNKNEIQKIYQIAVKVSNDIADIDEVAYTW